MTATIALAAMIAIAAPAVAGPAGASPQAADAGTAVVDIGPPLQYSFNIARIACRDGLSGPARLYGTGLDGSRYPLFETVLGWSDSVAATWYCWPGLVSLTFEGFDGGGFPVGSTLRLPVPVSAAGGGYDRSGNDGEAELLSSLPFPFRQAPFGQPRRRLSPDELPLRGKGSPEAVARLALATLFLPGRRAAPLAMLAAWTAAVIVAASLWRSRTRIRNGDAVTGVRLAGPGARAGKDRSLPWWGRAATGLALASAAGGLAWSLGAGPAELYSIGIHGAEDSLALGMTVVGHGGWDSVAWDPPPGSKPGSLAGRAGGPDAGLRFVAVRSPLAASIPVEAFSAYRKIRFRYPPLVVTAPDGTAALAAAPFSTAWGLHE